MKYPPIKRALDVGFSAFLLAAGALPLLAVGAAVRLDSPGPAIFRQTRLGKDGKPFEMYKFRSMVVGAEHTGSGVYSGKGDPRVTRVGRPPAGARASLLIRLARTRAVGPTQRGRSPSSGWCAGPRRP